MLALKRIGLVLAVGFVLFLVVGFLLPRQVHVERSVAIDAPPTTVFALLGGFRMFHRWSPWHGLDPNLRYTYSGPDFGAGATIEWAGDPKTVGSGRQEIVEARSPDRILFALYFGPDGRATGEYTLSAEGDDTRVTWGFDTDLGVNPLGRYFGLMMDGMVGKDFEKGLASLKILAEGLPKHDFASLAVERVEVEPATVAYVTARSGKDEQEIARTIGGAYGQVMQFMSQHAVKQAGPPITINRERSDAGYEFDAAIPIDRVPDEEIPADSPVQVKQTYAGTTLKVVHRGPYRNMQDTYLGLEAWMAAHGFEAGGPPWDEYVTDPGNTAEADLVTHVFMPVK